MFKKIAIGIVVVIAGILAVAAFQKEDYTVSRTTSIAASPEKIFGLVNNFHGWEKWSPWEKMDPVMKRVYEGPKAGVGAVYGWTGNSKVGEGRMTITESQPSQKVGMRLDFEKPMKDTCTSEFTFKPEGKGTLVTWSMAGKKKLAAKAMCLFMSMDKMIGTQFENGLNDLKALAEK